MKLHLQFDKIFCDMLKVSSHGQIKSLKISRQIVRVSDYRIGFDKIFARVLSLIQTKVFKLLVKSHEGIRTKLQFHTKNMF